jgi:hypothetical protein
MPLGIEAKTHINPIIFPFIVDLLKQQRAYSKRLKAY